MVKRIQLAYEDAQHLSLSKKKEALRQKLGVKRFGWEAFLWHVTGGK